MSPFTCLGIIFLSQDSQLNTDCGALCERISLLTIEFVNLAQANEGEVVANDCLVAQ